MKLSIFRMGLVTLFLMALSLPALAADKAVEQERNDILMREVSIIGSKFKVKDIAGSAAYIDVQEIREHTVDDVNRILRRVPGVNIREEDGMGLFPNISLRGVDSARTSKVTIMEDGILQAPAPYSAPSAYYFPNTGRMAGIEVLKGSSQVKYGPHTTGGAINFLSTPIPTTQKLYSKSTFGYWNEMRNHSYFGDTRQLENGGKMGYLIEYYKRSNNGFKIMDTNTPDVRGEPNTGFSNEEPMLKLFWEPKGAQFQRFEFKFGFSNLDANETYTGLNINDFRANPFRRYAGSRFDEIESTQSRTYLRHFLEIDNNTSLVTTFYGNTFNRNWQKLDDVAGTNQSVAMADPGSDAYLCLTGTNTAQCTFRVKNNNRTYYSWGAQSNLNHKLVTAGGTKHNIDLNVRYHYDQIRRMQWRETYTQAAGGGVTAVAVGARGSANDRTQMTDALAVNATDAIQKGKWTFTPGIRTEYIISEYCEGECGKAGVDEAKRDYAVIVGGGSLKYDVYDVDGRDLDWFAGIHRGFSPVGPRSGLRNDPNLREETSLGFEIGQRYKNAKKAFAVETVLFHNTIDDLIVNDSVGGTGSGNTVNAGEVRTMGVEFQANYDRGLHKGWAFQLPAYVALTYTNATFREDLGSTDLESIFAGAEKGNRVPYIPEMQVAFGLGWIYKKLSANIDANWVSESFADGNNTGAGPNINQRLGKIDSRLVMDAAVGYQWSDKVRLFSNFRNITQNEYIVSRQPHGPRPGMPFSMMGGFEVSL